jgi:hypothetical protein
LSITLHEQIFSLLGRDMLLEMARRYVWWKSPSNAIEWPLRVVRQVMNIGTFADMQAIGNTLGDDLLGDIVAGSEAGEFNARSWHYWHYRLELCAVDQVPPLPLRRFG